MNAIKQNYDYCFLDNHGSWDNDEDELISLAN